MRVVVMDEQPQGQFVKSVGLGEGKCLANKARQALAQSVVPALNVGGLSRFFAHRAVSLSLKYQLISFPEVAVGATRFVVFGNAIPQSAATVSTAITDEVGHDLARPTTEGNPDPAFVDLFENK